MLVLANGARIMSPSPTKKNKDRDASELGRDGTQGGTSKHKNPMGESEAPPIWRHTIITNPEVPRTTLLWITRSKFVKIIGHLRNVLHRNEMQMLIDQIPMFKDLLPSQRQGLAGAIDRQMMITKATGDVIFRQGDRPFGDSATMYITRKGSVRVTQVVDNGSIIVLHGGPLKAGTSFGEMALLNDELRDATVTATEPTELIALSRRFVTSILGSMSVIQEV